MLCSSEVTGASFLAVPPSLFLFLYLPLSPPLSPIPLVFRGVFLFASAVAAPASSQDWADGARHTARLMITAVQNVTALLHA